MAIFNMKCDCGEIMTVDATNRDGAIAMLKGMMFTTGIQMHMEKKHPGEPLIPVADYHQMIEERTVAA
ncbi:MAG: hypothetical protein G01um10148_964 [Parcubacteria group bacterium Gr01-1014_8]|nr:MAG: hypothetical protein G01um10148_964 [Parcubacteria group bacterium Gr01-1014_8]